MNAKEARQKALEVNTNENNALYLKAMNAIKNAVDRGLYSTSVDFTITGDLNTKLRSMGYELTNHSDYRDGSYCKISW